MALGVKVGVKGIGYPSTVLPEGPWAPGRPTPPAPRVERTTRCGDTSLNILVYVRAGR
jgi:hypothetical protein